MKVRIGGIEICDVSLEDLDEIVKRYGNLAQAEGDDGEGDPPSGSRSNGGDGKGGGRGNTTDYVILKKLVDAGTQGVPTADLGEMLGRRGKATRSAVRGWAHRIGITSDPAIDAFEETRVGTHRALRIKASLMDIAKAHMR